MKAQFATIEAVASIFMAFSAAATISYMLNGYPAQYNSDRHNLSMAIAATDFMRDLSANALANECLVAYLSINSPCMRNYSSEFEKVYGINNISVVNGNDTLQQYNIYCSSVSEMGLLCIGVS